MSLTIAYVLAARDYVASLDHYPQVGPYFRESLTMRGHSINAAKLAPRKVEEAVKPRTFILLKIMDGPTIPVEDGPYRFRHNFDWVGEARFRKALSMLRSSEPKQDGGAE